MRWKNFKAWFKEFWSEFSQVKYGIVGLVLLAVFILMVIFEPLLIPFPDAGSRWRDISYWRNNPTNAEPAWSNWFRSKKLPEHLVLDEPDMKKNKLPGGQDMKVIETTFKYDYQADQPPRDIVFQARGLGNVTMTIQLVRPDGRTLNISRKNIKTQGSKDMTVSLGNKGVSEAYSLIKEYEDEEVAKNLTKSKIHPINVLFSKGQKGIHKNPEPLKGEYQVKINAVAVGKNSDLINPYIIAEGRVFGILGTDNSKRDIWSGIVVGIKWAMLIGLLVAFFSVTIGVIYGVSSAYFGGWIDSLMMRIYEVVRSIPMLPLLIVMSAIFQPSIWTLIGIMCALYWVGSVRTVRSIGLQIKEETYVEAARALDASNSRIIFKHMIPQLIPYTFASMALRVPGAILAEASVSLLGLGDATIVTWGQILHDAMNSGAVLQGLWWWIIPPGICIAMMGMTFAFIGFAMDKILTPKLKTR